MTVVYEQLGKYTWENILTHMVSIKRRGNIDSLSRALLKFSKSIKQMGKVFVE